MANESSLLAKRLLVLFQVGVILKLESYYMLKIPSYHLCGLGQGT